MLRIGNDIVDLNLAKTQSNWQRPGFLEKQFTQKEQAAILKSENPFEQVWLFWSMKEAAYKCYTQEYQERFYAPLKFSCKVQDKISGSVIIKHKKYNVNYIVTSNYIHTIAHEVTSIQMATDFFLVDYGKHPSKIIRQKLLKHFGNNVQLKKNALGIPYLSQNNKELPISISISHHGKYAAFLACKRFSNFIMG